MIIIRIKFFEKLKLVFRRMNILSIRQFPKNERLTFIC